MKEVTKCVVYGYPVNVMYLDFQPAFDKVSHRRVIAKSAAHSFDGELIRWMENWLSENIRAFYSIILVTLLILDLTRGVPTFPKLA